MHEKVSKKCASTSFLKLLSDQLEVVKKCLTLVALCCLSQRSVNITASPFKADLRIDEMLSGDPIPVCVKSTCLSVYLFVRVVQIVPADGHSQGLGRGGTRTDDLRLQTMSLEHIQESVTRGHRP